MEVGMLRADARVVKPGRNGMGTGNLTVFVLQDIAQRTLKDAGSRGREPRRVISQRGTAPPGLNADHAYSRLTQEFMKQSDGVASSTHTGEQQVGEPVFRAQDLLAGLPPDDGLEIAHHPR